MPAPSSNPESGLRRQLTAGQMTMVAVGGSIGTGLLLGTAAAIELAGPAVILSFVLAAFISWTVALALGELASTHPAAGSFGVYGDLYLNHWAGFISRAGYWLGIEAFWSDPAEDDEHIAWGRATMAALKPFTRPGNYINDVVESDVSAVRAAYGDEKYERLVALKRAYDPDNAFRLNQNIRP